MIKVGRSSKSIEKLPEDPKSQVRVLTFRTLITGLVCSAVICFWMHYSELVVGTKGHMAFANTSIPFGAFTILLALVSVNMLVRWILPGLAFSKGEILVVYVMTTISTVISSSGGLHLLIPTLTAAHYFANSVNGWGGLFQQYIPTWMAQTNPDALHAFYAGNSPFILDQWTTQIAVWVGFLFVFSGATLCISILLRKQWIENEKLPFPTVALPLELIKDGVPLFRDRLFWMGSAVAFFLGVVNTLHLNIPSFPGINVRCVDIGLYAQVPPWNAIGWTPISFFPFAIAIGYLLSTEVAFSCWFFYLFTKAELVFGAAMRSTSGGGYGSTSVFPYIGYQGAGAFLGLAVLVLWQARGHLKQIFKQAFPHTGDTSNDPDAGTYRWAFIGLAVCMLVMISFAVAAGARGSVAFLLLLVVLCYLIAATRIRAETGNVWPVGPDVDGLSLMQSMLGTRFFSAADLTVLTYVKQAVGTDMRGSCMPHQLDALKMADSAKLDYRKLIVPMMVAVAVGVTISFIIALAIWTHFGALAKTEPWRSLIGNTVFSSLEQQLKMPKPIDWNSIKGVSAGAIITGLLGLFRMRYIWWPFHPVGYAMANTHYMNFTWCPFFVAWLIKVVLIKFGGLKLYKRALPFFFGLFVGDVLHGALFMLVGCFTNLSVYPVNW
ncbi:MAG: DUF6785 family protein [Armatimonadota bacterium]